MDRPTDRRQGLRSFQQAVIAVAAVLCLILAMLLAQDVARRLEALARASADNLQWTLSQMEVELLMLHGAALTAASAPEDDLADLRRRFDVFFSRIAILEESPAFAPLRAHPAFEADIGLAQRYLAGNVSLIDGPDATLRAGLAGLVRDTAALRAPVRDMALKGLMLFAAQAEMQRLAVASTLLRVAALTVFVVLALLALAVQLWRLNRRSAAQAAENRATGSRLETIVSTSVDAILVVGQDLRILAFNPAAEAMFGYTRDEAVGAIASDLTISPDTLAASMTLITDNIIGPDNRNPAQPRIELEMSRRDGSLFPAEVSVAEADSADGGIFVAFVRDISRRKQADRDLTEARDRALAGEKIRADFLAVMSHEMRTPLNGLLASMEILEATPLSARQRELVEVMETSGRLLLHHVNSVLDLTRAEAGLTRPIKVGFHLETLVAEVLANQLALAESVGGRIVMAARGAPVGRVVGDPGGLRQVLLNLIGNAVKYAPGGTITVSIAGDAVADGLRMVDIRVSDTGHGIAFADQARVFDDFVTIEPASGRSAGGTGLGLGIARRLMQAMGGEIGLQSTPGQGSTFWLRLPFGIETTPAPLPPIIRATSFGEATQRRLSVLLVEDNAINRFVVRALLEESGHRVTEAGDGLVGVARAASAPHDVILMDVSMPELDGIEATRRIRAGGQSARSRIVALTAHALPADHARFRRAGMDDWLIKPVSRAALLAALTPLRAPPAGGTDMPALLDAQQVADLAAQLGPAAAAGLLARFFAETDDGIAELTGPLAANGVAALAHRLAGSAGTFGARRLHDRLVTIEIALRDGTDLSALRTSLIDDLPCLWADTRRALETAL